MSDPSRLDQVIAQCRRAHEHFPARETREATASELLVEEIERLRAENAELVEDNIKLQEKFEATFEAADSGEEV